jgi:outer membrane protein assembly factor BamB
MAISRLAAFLVLIGLCGIARPDDWMAFRGTDGTARGKGTPPVEWSATKNIRWKRELPGPGSSSAIVLKDRVYLTCYTGYGIPNGPRGSLSELKRHLIAINRADGEIVWDKAIAADSPEDPYSGFLTEHGYASSTPVTDGERIYVFFGKTGVLAFDLDGNELWRTNVGKESSPMHWGSGASPVLVGDLLVVNAGDESLSLRAIEKVTGKEAWKSEGNVLEAAYGTPTVSTLADGRKDIVISGSNEVWGINPDNGKLRWYFETGKQGNITPSVIVADGIGYLFGGRGTRTLALKLGGKGEVKSDARVWAIQPGSNVPTPVLVDGRLYWVNERGIAYCVDAKSGEVLMEHRLGIDLNGRPVYASPIEAAGRIYQVTSQGGTVVFAAKPEFELLARNVIEGDSSDFNSTPAQVDDELYLRSNKALYCIGEPRAK